MSPKTFLGRLRRWLAPLAGLVFFGAALGLYYCNPRDHVYSLSLTAGNPTDTRHELAELLRAEVSSRGLLLDLEPTVGSEQALDRVNNHNLDLALVQGGLAVGNRAHVRQVATLHVEPLHLLVKQVLFQEVATHLGALEGKTVNTGEVGSGTHTLSTRVLDFAGLRPRQADSSRGYMPSHLGRSQVLAEPASQNLPDAIFLVSSLPSRTARQLVARHGYRLVPLPFGEAFTLSGLAPAESARLGAGLEGGIDPKRTYAVTIPPYTYGVETPVPAQPLPSLGNRLLLVAHDSVETEAAKRLVEAAYAGEFAKTVQPPLDPKLLDYPPEFPWHSGTRLYLQNNQPLVSKDMMDLYHKAVAILAAAASGLFVLWQWRRLCSESSRLDAFKHYFHRVNRLEERARLEGWTGSQDLADVLALQEHLVRLKTEALDRFTEGDLEGKELLGAFVTHVQGVYDHLSRLLTARHGPPARQREGLALPSSHEDGAEALQKS
jgi:TRAP-type uncharacterized transport system substrate-binding protein